MKGGRPSKCTPEVTQALCNHVRNGLPESVAASLVGVAPDTVLEWLSRARGQSDRKPRPEHVQFAQELHVAIAESEARLLRVINRAATGYFVRSFETTTSEKDGTTTKRKTERRVDWSAAAWLLERRMPERWRPRTDVVHSGEVAMVKTIHLAGPTAASGAAGLPPDIAQALAAQHEREEGD